MDQYPPGDYISRATRTLPRLGPNLLPQTVQIDARPLWGVFRVTFVAKQDPRQGMHNWFRTMQSGERIKLGQPAPGAGVGNQVVRRADEGNAGAVEEPVVSLNRPMSNARAALKISDLIASLQDIQKEQGDLTVAEEAPLGFFAIRYVETKVVEKHLAVLGVSPGETVVLIYGQ